MNIANNYKEGIMLKVSILVVTCCRCFNRQQVWFGFEESCTGMDDTQDLRFGQLALFKEMGFNVFSVRFISFATRKDDAVVWNSSSRFLGSYKQVNKSVIYTDLYTWIVSFNSTTNKS